MGMFLTKPSTKKHSNQGGDFENYGVRYGVSGMQGWRVSMEDAHLALPKLSKHSELSLFGVFDGHGGSVISEWVSKHIESIFEEELDLVASELNSNELVLDQEKSKLPAKVVIISEALQRTYIKLDEQMAAPSSRPEQRAIYDQKKSSNEVNQPKTFLQELLGGIDGQKRVLRMVEQNGNKFLQIVSFNGDEESGNAELEDTEKKIEEVQEKRESVEESTSVTTGENLDPVKVTQNHDYHEAEETNSNGIVPFESDVNCMNNESPFESADQSLAEDECLEEDSYMEDLSDSGACGPDHCGTTAVVAVIVQGNSNQSPFLIVANAGDSRAVLSRSGQAIALSHDHKPELPIENERILKAHGTVENGRVDGNLNMSRTLGDLQYKSDETLTPREQKITAFPDVRIIPLTSEDEFIILACDGIWDVVDNQLCVDIVRRKMLLQINNSEDTSNSSGKEVEVNTGENFTTTNGKPYSESHLDGSSPIPPLNSIQLSDICEEICDECLAPNPVESEGIGCDNMTLMIVQLGPSTRSVCGDSSSTLVSPNIGSAVAKRLQATAVAIDNQKLQPKQSSDSSEANSKDQNNDLDIKDDQSLSDTNNKKSPDAVINNTILPKVPWIPKKDFNVVLYGFGVDDGRFDNVPENRF
ncbi:Ppm1g-prov protein [Cryptosporidium bovis]|uniref:Ppm1g-prov protein n=1 Tax=Cryptosporidium bovis TaxID=310047 RepID=UPI00351A634B|nr:Ppm1g-prov protein [Cryptosporidium bovis]